MKEILCSDCGKVDSVMNIYYFRIKEKHNYNCENCEVKK